MTFLTAAGVAAAVLVVLSALTWKQVQIWHNSEKLWRHALAVTPESSTAHYNLGNILADRDELEEAIWHYRQALRINPTDYTAHNNLGNALRSQGQLEEAIGHYRQALRINPAHSMAHSNLGIALVGQGRVEAAMDHFTVGELG